MMGLSRAGTWFALSNWLGADLPPSRFSFSYGLPLA